MSQAVGAVTRKAAVEKAGEGVAVAILVSLSFSHMLNDMIQALLPAIYPLLKQSYGLSFAQIGLLTFAFQVMASLLQPLVGLYTDRRPQPFSLAVGMGFTLVGLIVLGHAAGFWTLVAGAMLIGVGSSVFHPESSRMARVASGGRHGMAQSVFQVGGNFGQSLGPLMAAFIVIPFGQGSVSWFALVALVAIGVVTRIGLWYRRNHVAKTARAAPRPIVSLSRRRVAGAVAVLLLLIFSKYFYLASITSYYIFYLTRHFHVSVESGQIHLFAFLAAVALGTLVGGPIGDRIGRKYVIWASILGVLPFTLMLPTASLFWTGVLTVVIGLVLSSAFSAILVYATELVPGKVGTIAGMFFGFAFGMGGIGAAVLGQLADSTSIEFVYRVCSFLPAIGLLTVFLPNIEPARKRLARG